MNERSGEMKSFKNIRELYKLDWKRIFHNKLTFLLVIALMILPSLYAWFNIAALWDPYSNTGDIAIAVYSDDKTVNIMDKDVNVGDKIIENLRENTTIGWQFVDSKEELNQGVKDGSYYAGIYLPEDFSEDLISFVNGEIKKPELEYIVNQKINAIAPKIADKGASTIKDTISNQFVEVASETLLEVFNDIGFELDENLTSINKLTSKILEIDENMDKIDGYTKEIQNLNAKMPEFKSKLDKANGFIDYMPQVDAMGNKLIGLNSMMPEIEKSGKLILTVQGKIPEIQNAGRQIKMIDEDFDDLVDLMNKAVDEAKKGVVIIQDAQKVMPEVKELAVNSNNMISGLQDDVKYIQKALPTVASGVERGLNLVKIVSNQTVNLTNALYEYLGNKELTDVDKANIKAQLDNISKNLSSKSKIIDGTIKALESMQNQGNSDKLTAKIEKLKNTKNLIDSLIVKVDSLQGKVDNLSIEELKANIKMINAEATKINNIVNSINVEEIIVEVNALLKEIDNLLSTAGNITGTIIDENLIDRIDSLMDNTVGIINQTIEFMDKYQKEIPMVKSEIHSANEILNGNMDTIIDTINKAASIYNNDLPVVKQKLNKATVFVQRDLPKIENDLVKTMDMANEKFPEVEKALNMADDLIRYDWPNIKRGVHKAADAIRRGQEDIDLNELIKMLKSDVEQESDFIANPVEMSQTDIYPIPNYGSASTPFYTALCLWVGGLLLASMASTEFYLDKEQQEKYTKREQFLARMMTYYTIGFFQALIVSLGNLFLLGVYSVHPIYHILFSIFVGFVFMTILYVLVATMGNLGKGAGVIILVLSISGGGGNFPIEMSGEFFRRINPILPFTHAVNLIRETIGGIYWPNANKSLAVLFAFAVGFFIFGLIAYPKMKAYFKKLNDKLHEGHLLH